MFSRAALVILALVALEVVALTQLAGLFGLADVILALLLASAIGALLLRRVAPGFFRSSIETVRAAGPNAERRNDAIADRAVLVVAALLLVMPGLVTGVIGLLLLVPPIRALVRPMVLNRVQPWLRSTLRFGRMGAARRDVVDVDVVDVDPRSTSASTRTRPELS